MNGETKNTPSEIPPVKVTFKDALKAAETIRLFACDYSMYLSDLVYQTET